MEMDSANQQTEPVEIQPPQNQNTPKPNQSRTVIIGIATIIILVIIVGIEYYLWGNGLKSLVQNKSSSKQTTEKNLVDNQSKRINLQTFSLSKTDLSDSATELYFSDANKLYKVRLDGSQPQEITSPPNNISDGNKYYTKELPNGEAEIMLDKHDGSAPTKIGLLTQKLITTGCVFDPCPGKTHPGEFYPSFDGSYLLNKPPGGGGLGQSAVAISRDGSRVYNIDFYWYGSSAIWIGNNKLLTKGQGPEGKQEVITFKEDGTMSKSVLQQDLRGYFDQSRLSPSGKLLFVSDGVVENSLYDFGQNKNIPVETFNEEPVRTQLNLLPEETIEHWYIFLGWNKNSDKVFYGSTTRVSSGAHYTDGVAVWEIKVYDIKSGKVYTVAKSNFNPKEELGNFVIR